VCGILRGIEERRGVSGEREQDFVEHGRGGVCGDDGRRLSRGRDAELDLG
jgi:hypothetical protein